MPEKGDISSEVEVARAQLKAAVKLGESEGADAEVRALAEVVKQWEKPAQANDTLRDLIAQAKYNTGNILGSQGKVAEAVNQYAAVVAQYADDEWGDIRYWASAAQFNCAILLEDHERLREAAAQYRRTVSRCI